jgi:hypothetical protein
MKMAHADNSRSVRAPLSSSVMDSSIMHTSKLLAWILHSNAYGVSDQTRPLVEKIQKLEDEIKRVKEENIKQV